MSGRIDLGERGRAIWDEFKAESLPAHHRALVQEAARLADTLDRLSALAAGKQEAWASIVVDELGEVTLLVDKILAEMRQQQLAFKQLVMEIRQAQIAPVNKPKDETADDKPDNIVDILSRRAAGEWPA